MAKYIFIQQKVPLQTNTFVLLSATEGLKRPQFFITSKEKTTCQFLVILL